MSHIFNFSYIVANLINDTRNWDILSGILSDASFGTTFCANQSIG